ncbi:hypothetical protein J6590_002682 [Homalodisca vitripennis]|nr:hypothetical protein J6590_002682 [Homalodisca vitripennis]
MRERAIKPLFLKDSPRLHNFYLQFPQEFTSASYDKTRFNALAAVDTFYYYPDCPKVGT